MKPPAEPIRILVVDDHLVVRAGLKALLDSEPDMRVVGEAADEAEAVAAFTALAPHVTVMDLRLTQSSGLDVAARLFALDPAARVIVFSSYTREQDIYAAMKTGICSYVRKGGSASELLQAIRAAHAGKRYISPEIGEQVVGHIAQDDLSVREREVLQLMFEGRSNREIATRLGISEHTVNIHTRNVMGKLGASRRTEAIATALRKGILRID